MRPEKGSALGVGTSRIVPQGEKLECWSDWRPEPSVSKSVSFQGLSDDLRVSEGPRQEGQTSNASLLPSSPRASPGGTGVNA